MNNYRVEFENSVQLVEAGDSDFAVWNAQELAGDDAGALIDVVLLSEGTEMSLRAKEEVEAVVLPSRRQRGMVLAVEASDTESDVDLTVHFFGWGASLACAANEGVLYHWQKGERELTAQQYKIVEEWADYADLYIEEFFEKNG